MDRRIGHSEETRIQAARYFDKGFGYQAVASYLGLPAGTVRTWRDSHRQGRLLNSHLVGENRRYSQEMKVAAVEKFLAGTPKAEIILEFHISNRSLFNKWVAIYRKDGVAGLDAKPKGRKRRQGESESLEEKVRRLEMENALLKKYQALMIEDLTTQHSKRRRSHH